MIQFPPSRTFVRLVAAVSVLAACGRSEQADTTDSTAAADTAASTSAAPAPSPSAANNTAASL